MRFLEQETGSYTMKKLLGVLAVSAAFVLSGASGAGAEKLRLKMGSAFPSKIIQIGSMGVQLEKTVDAVSGGEKKMQEIYAKHGLYSMICGVIAPEASGLSWRSPISRFGCRV